MESESVQNAASEVASDMKEIVLPKQDLGSTSSGVQDPPRQTGDASQKRGRKRLVCKGSFKMQPVAKYLKEGGLPMPGILDFPPHVQLSKGSLMYGTFCADIKLVRLSNCQGKMASHMGFVKPGSQGTYFLHPEEAIFLIEAGRLILHYNDLDNGNDSDEIKGSFVTSVQEAYCLLLSSDIPLGRYLVYARLARSGFKVIISTKQRFYDAHIPTADFAKTHPPPPAFRVIGIYKWEEPFPSITELINLQNEGCSDLGTNSDVALKIAIVAPDGDVSFYSVNCPLPT